MTETNDTNDRFELAQREMEALFGMRWDVEPRPGDPPNARDLDRIMMEHAFGDSWARRGLDSKTKSMLTIAISVAMGQQRELRSHVHGALHIGVTRDEIVELLIHTTAYVGIARTSLAWSTVRKVFAETV